MDIDRPIDLMDTKEEAVRYFKRIVKGQHGALLQIITEIWYMCRICPYHQKMTRILLAGRSSESKTNTIQMIKSILALPETNYIKIDCSTLVQERSRFYGRLSPTQARHEDKESLLYRLLSLTNQEEVPRTIVIHFDHFNENNKTEDLSMLMDDGRIRSPEGVEFKLPSKVELIILVDTEFGASKVKGINQYDHHDERRMIEEVWKEMRKSGFGSYFRSQFDNVAVFL